MNDERSVDVRAIRTATALNQTQFASRFGIAVGTLRDWEQRRRAPEGPARVLLRLIAADPAWVSGTLGARTAIVQSVPRDPLATYLEQWRAQEGPQVDLDAFVFRATITLIAVTIDAEFRQLARSVGLTVGDLRVLFALRRAPEPHELRPADLLRQLLVTSGAISKQLQRLEGRALVRRMRQRSGDSGVYIRLTAAGQRLVSAAIVHRRAAYRISGPAFARIAATEREQGLRFLRDVVAGLRDPPGQRAQSMSAGRGRPKQR
jgi:DNA-binding MarR family transcriptional regulator